MIPELGHFALILALLVAIVQASLPLYGAARGDAGLTALARPAAMLQFALVAVAFAVLMQRYVVSDFSVANVFQNSHTLKPMLYKISGVWGNHEGSLMLWALMLTLFGAAVAAWGGNLPVAFQARVLAVQAMVGVGFLAFMLLTSNPFARILPAPGQGKGLNPLLQDPGLAFHPPFLYGGYVGFSIAFSFAVAALIEGRVDPAWARWVRPWTLAAWASLTLGIAMGSWWAYYELGWGGWWFWDPVENASLMPWLAGTALLHSAIVVEKRETLKSWTILLAILTFSLSLLGTFLVRSGVLTSVHAFATDPARGAFILAFLAVTVGGSLTLYALRAPALKATGFFQPISREGSLLFNNLLLVTAAATVFLGTLYPLFLDAATGKKVSVGGPFFNATVLPVMAPLVAAMAIGPLLPWKRAELGAALLRLKLAGLGALGLAALAAWQAVGQGPLLAFAGVGLGAWVILSSLAEWADRVGLFRLKPAESMARAAGLPRATYGMTLAHTGMGLVILGMTVVSIFQQERQLVMKPNQTVEIAGYVFKFGGVREVRGPNYDALRGSFRLSRDGDDIAVMRPEMRNYPTPPMTTTEAALRVTPLGDLYAVVGESDGQGGNAVRIYWKPLVTWIWGGAIVMVIGGVISLTDRRLRVGIARRRRREPALAAEPAE